MQINKLKSNVYKAFSSLSNEITTLSLHNRLNTNIIGMILLLFKEGNDISCAATLLPRPIFIQINPSPTIGPKYGQIDKKH